MSKTNVQPYYIPSPYLEANCLSRQFFCWINGLFWKGYKKGGLDPADIYKVLPGDSSKVLGDRLNISWTRELTKEKPSLRRAILSQFFCCYMGMGFLIFLEECVIRILQPMFLGFLIRYFNHTYLFPKESRPWEWEGYVWAGGIVLGSIGYLYTHHTFFFGVFHGGMQLRIAVSDLIYRKALRLSQAALQETTIGQMVNLLSSDVQRFESVLHIHYIWVGTLQIAIITYLLWDYYDFGLYSLAGLIVVILYVPFQGLMGHLFSRLRAKTALKTDQRIRTMNEILTSMKVIKIYSWEAAETEEVDRARKNEMKFIRTTSCLRTINLSLYYTSAKIIVFVMLIAYVLAGNRLSAEQVFVALALYHNVRLSMMLNFPNGVANLAEIFVSIRRLQKFLLLEERQEPSDTDQGSNDDENKSLPVTVQLKRFTAKWNPKHETDTLHDLSFAVDPGELVVITGQVGSGKSSVLQGILKELPPSSGSIQVKGSIGYASQDPWIFSGSIRENILLGKEYQGPWYRKVIEACALTRDFSLFPHSDFTLVGEKGTLLSGGQKSRVSLARLASIFHLTFDIDTNYEVSPPVLKSFLLAPVFRAVYANADIYLLDDPLSAVDSEVARHILEKCINGILKDKARILVTHQISLLKGLPRIIVLDEGRLEFEGSFEDLTTNGMEFLISERLKEGSTSLIKPEVPGSKERIQEISGPPKAHESILLISSPIPSERASTKSSKVTVSATPPKSSSESSASGNVKWSLYWKYLWAGSNWFTIFLLVLTNILTQGLYTYTDYYLSIWTKSEKVSRNETKGERNSKRKSHIIIYSSLIGALFLVSTIRTIIFFRITVNASLVLHSKMFRCIIRAPMRFFDLNAVGRILNRFSKDMDQMDDALPYIFFDAVTISLNVIGIIVLLGWVNPILLIPAGVLGLIFYFLRIYYLYTARSVKRIETVAKSPVFSHLSSTLHGLGTIRAFKVQEDFTRLFEQFQDAHSATWFLVLVTSRWFGIMLDLISNIFIALVTFSFFIFKDETSDSDVGLAVANVMMLMQMFQRGVRQATDVESVMVSVERIIEYTRLEPEAPLESKPGTMRPLGWPYKGKIEMIHIQLQYGSDPPVLKDISFVISPREKIGIVGRTGAGKSSLITALFRLTEPTSGEILIDNVNILKLGLHDFRSKISIIPQDPTLFAGSLRRNLDPFNEYSEDKLWRVLEEIQLSHEVKQLAAGLDVEVAEAGSNYSVGQRQLICLGRAILRQNKILVLDEPTANVDQRTDELIQEAIRNNFWDCTVLTIAHRLNTVMDSDRILVMDAGTILEFDEPLKLLQDPKSALSHMVQETGSASAGTLRDIAEKAAEVRRRSPIIRNVVKKLINEKGEGQSRSRSRESSMRGRHEDEHQ